MSTLPEASPRDPASIAAALLAIDPHGLGGATLRARAGPARDRWVAHHRALRSPDIAWRRLPPNTGDSRLLGGLDLAATLGTGRPVAERGVLADADGGVLIAPMAERMRPEIVGPLAATVDSGEVVTERDGVALRASSRFTLILLDEGIDDERAATALTDRLAFMLDLADGGLVGATTTRRDIAAARDRLAAIVVDDATLEAVCAIGLAFGVTSLRVASFMLKAAKAAAALAGHDRVMPDDLALAAALIVAPRATIVPASQEQEPEAGSETQSEAAPNTNAADDSRPDDGESTGLTDRLVDATRAALPSGLLASVSDASGPVPRQSTSGRAGMVRTSERHGRPAGVRRGLPGRGGRLAIVDTLRAAAPWQKLRRSTQTATSPRVLVRRDDFRVARYKQRSETTTIFVVDASGSAAFNRLAEVKGAVELILADCYIRRDSVALIAFRGTTAELVLPPTRSLTRAKRVLAGQPGGGGTPLATAIETATALASAQHRKGVAPLVVLLTDGHGNIARSGRPGRAEAEADALAAAKLLRATSLPCLLIDVAPRPQALARSIADALGARYQPLPFVDARALSQAVLASAPRTR